GDSLTWSATGLPSGLDIDQDSGVISGRVNGGGQYSVRVTVNDGRGGSDSETFSWIVNRKPTVNNPGNQTSRVCTSQSVSLQISASDPDGNGLSYSAPELPSGLSINGSGLITGKPTTAQNKTVSVSVSDGRGGIDSTSFSWTTIANTKPSITKPATQATARNQAANLQLSVSDANGDPVTVTVTGLPQGLTYNPSTRKISGTVSKSAAQQNYTVTISATDNCGGASTQTFTWQVVNTNPVWNPVPVNQSTAEGEDVNLTIKATDANGDTITYKATNLPQGLNLDPNTGQIRGRVLSSGNRTVTLEAVDGNQGKVEKTIFWTVTSPQKVGYVGQVSLSKSAYLEARNDITKNGWIKVTHNQNIGSDEVGQRPIVIAQPITKPDDNSAVALIRLRNVTSNSFEYNVHLQPGALKEDFPNSAVKFTYMVVKEGNWEFRTNNRQIIEIKAGLTTTQNGNHTVWTPNRCDESDTNLGNFKSVSFGFGNTFKSTPAIFTQIQTNNVAGFVTTRQRASSTSGFDVAMQEADYANNPSHNSETIGYVAMTTTQGGAGQKWDGTNFEVGRLNMRKQVAVSGWGAPWWQVVEFNNYYGSSASAMRFIGSLSTWNGKNHVHLRYKNHSTYGDSLLIKMEEDTTVPDRYDCNGDGIAEKENPDPNHEHIHDETMDYFAIYQNKVLEAFTKGTLDHSAASLDLDMVEVDAQSTQVGYSKSGGEISLATDPIEFGPQLAPEGFQTQQTEQVQVTIRKNYLAGGTPIAQRTVEKIETTVTEDSLHFIYTDHLGSASTLVNAATQEVDQSVRFYPFGELWTGEEELGEITDRGFTGHRENRDIGLTYMNARFYVPSVGKFASADTIVPDPANPQTLNRYAYVYNNPTNLNDPSGHCPNCISAAASAATDMVGQMIMNYLFDNSVENFEDAWNSINWAQVVWSGLEGFFIPGGPLGEAIASGASDVAINGATAWWNGTEYSAQQALQDFAMGAISGFLGDAAGDLMKKYGSDAVQTGMRKIQDIFGGGGCSFSYDTLISTEDGFVPIGEIEIGDWVWAFDEAAEKIDLFPVTDTFKHHDTEIVYLTIDSIIISTTPEHPFYTIDDEWVNAGSLSVGDEVRSIDWTVGEVENVVTVINPRWMYNFTVGKAHTYFVGVDEWLVHNASNCPIPRLHHSSLTGTEADELYNVVNHIRQPNAPRPAGHVGKWGATHSNREGNLPMDVDYKEFYVPTNPTESVFDPERPAGARRVVLGSDGSIYYTNTHYGESKSKNPFYFFGYR
ncbi:MAG: putative Ig domain-containing protein, partial [Chloroflexota bacterium]